MAGIKQKTILLVVGDSVIAMVEAQKLKNEGYNVIVASKEEKAIDIVCNKNTAVNLILMDIDLGQGIDGTQSAKEILKTQSMPILFLSSHTEKEIVEKTEKITSFGYVIKDSSFTVLDASIKMAFRLYDVITERKRAEDELRNSESKFPILFNKAAFPTILSNYPGNEFVDENETWLDRNN